MMNQEQLYCGDTAMREMLNKAGSPRTIHEIYGLFYGCLGASHFVRPSDYLPLILDDSKPLQSLEVANQLMGSLMSLWNGLACCTQPGEKTFYFPRTEYPKSPDGLKQRIVDDRAMMDYFMKGLDLGGTNEEEFSPNALGATKELAEIMAHLQRYLELLDTDPEAKNQPTAETLALFDGLEDGILGGFKVIIDSLRGVRQKNVEGMGAFRPAPAPTPARSTKVGRNDLCPCGSGKKYKKCCAGSA